MITLSMQWNKFLIISHLRSKLSLHYKSVCCYFRKLFFLTLLLLIILCPFFHYIFVILACCYCLFHCSLYQIFMVKFVRLCSVRTVILLPEGPLHVFAVLRKMWLEYCEIIQESKLFLISVADRSSWKESILFTFMYFLQCDFVCSSIGKTDTQL